MLGFPSFIVCLHEIFTLVHVSHFNRFDIDGAPHIIKFADKLETILVNNYPFNIRFGGPAVPIYVRNNEHYLRLSELPPGVVPGKVEIACMQYFRTQPPPSAPVAPGRSASWPVTAATTPSTQVGRGARSSEADFQEEHEPALPVRGTVGGKYFGL